MKKKKDLDLAPSRRERKTFGQYILLFFLVLYTLFCALPIVLVFVAAFSDEKTIVQNGFQLYRMVSHLFQRSGHLMVSMLYLDMASSWQPLMV